MNWWRAPIGGGYSSLMAIFEPEIAQTVPDLFGFLNLFRTNLVRFLDKTMSSANQCYLVIFLIPKSKL